MSRIEKSERHIAMSETWPADICCNGNCHQGRLCPRYRVSEPLFAKGAAASAAVAISLVMACAAIALILSGVWS